MMAALLVMTASVGTAPSESMQPNAWRTFPRVTLWAWESRQDLRHVSPEKYAIAYLDRTVFITDQIGTIPRRQPLLIPQDASVIAVVRIEAPQARAKLDAPELAERVATKVVEASRRQQVSALQIDFDATRSQRSFYRKLIEETRRRMPAKMPLSITALASWCSWPSWLEGLPVDEAVPMLFRMGGDSRSAKQPGWNYEPTAPQCSTSVGVSTDEAWPAITTNKRIYVFHPRAWSPVALENLEKLITP
ncbi:MAG: DUF3142 domain-containing protein [Candidatus Angelobacter sp.]